MTTPYAHDLIPLRFVLEHEALAHEWDRDGTRRMKHLLKAMLRGYGMECISIVAPNPAPAPPRSTQTNPSNVDHLRDHPDWGVAHADRIDVPSEQVSS